MKWNKVTLEMLRTIPRRYKNRRAYLLGCKYAYAVQDNFTVMLLKHKGGIEVGVAKRNPDDNVNPEIGEQVAWVRAYRRFIEAQNG